MFAWVFKVTPHGCCVYPWFCYVLFFFPGRIFYVFGVISLCRDMAFKNNDRIKVVSVGIAVFSLFFSMLFWGMCLERAANA